MVTAGSVPIAREVAVNTITGAERWRRVSRSPFGGAPLAQSLGWYGLSPAKERKQQASLVVFQSQERLSYEFS